MVFEFIPPIWAGVLLLTGILGLVFRSKLALMIAKVNPFFPAKTTLLVFGIIGILAGGIAGMGMLWGSVTGSVASVSMATADDSAVMTDLTRCSYSTGDAINESISIAQASNGVDVYVTIDNSTYFGSDGSAIGSTNDLVNITWNCDRTGNTGEDASVFVLAGGDTFLSDLSTSSANEYALTEATGSSQVSPFFDDWERKVYVNDGAVATTSSKQEGENVEFTESQKTRSIGILLDLDETAVQQIGIGTQYTKDFKLYKEINGNRVVIANIQFSKVA